MDCGHAGHSDYNASANILAFGTGEGARRGAFSLETSMIREIDRRRSEWAVSLCHTIPNQLGQSYQRSGDGGILNPVIFNARGQPGKFRIVTLWLRTIHRFGAVFAVSTCQPLRTAMLRLLQTHNSTLLVWSLAFPSAYQSVKVPVRRPARLQTDCQTYPT